MDWESCNINRGCVVGTLFFVVFIDLTEFVILIPVIPLYAESFGANDLFIKDIYYLGADIHPRYH